MEPVLAVTDALIAVDVQNDFMPGGSLPVPDGDAVVPVVNQWLRAAVRGNAVIAASRDWHPADHVSFQENGGPWPTHCVQETPGAAFHPNFALPEDFLLVTKGDTSSLEQYSAFDATGLAERLRGRGVTRIFVCGLALDVCVKATVQDGVRLGFETSVITAASRAIDKASGQQATDEMRRAGAIILE